MTTVNNAKLKPTQHTQREELETYRILHMSKTEELWNTAINEHKIKTIKGKVCEGDLQWDETSEISHGLCWEERLCCKNCGYKSKHCKLYKEVRSGKPGRPAADLNIRIQIGLTHTMISNTALQRLLASANIPPPSYSGMQKMADKVGEAIIDLNKKDLRAQRNKLKEFNVIKCLPASAGIRVEADARYNNKLGSGGGRTPFQPATQVTYTVIENETPRKRVIGLFTGNKLCRSKKHKENKPHKCTANIEEDHTIGDEGQWARNTMSGMKEDGEMPPTIAYATTDGDSMAAKGIAAGQRDKSGNKLVNLSCTNHLAESQRRAFERTNFSDSMFPPTTKKDKGHMKSMLARNLKRRCTAEYNAAFPEIQQPGRD